MKKSLFVLALVLLVSNSCRKVCGCFTPPPPKQLNFQVIGKDGKSLVKSLQDSVTITYTNNDYSNTNKTLRLVIRKLYTNFSDTTTVSTNYNGLYITDFGQMSILSSQVPPATTFSLRVNGQNVGIINVNYQQYQATYPQFSAAGLNFNNMPVSYENGVDLLQLK